MKYLIIGGTGSLGKKIIHRLLPKNQVSIMSRDEMKQWSCRNDLENIFVGRMPKFYVGDIRDCNRVKDVISQSDPDVIIIAAALKQVDTCELSPTESIATNLLGTQNVIKSTNELTPFSSKQRKVLFVSTDKACSSVNTYGMCKALSERLITSQAQSCTSNVIYMCTRYGNVLESRGSIIPLFKYQAENNEFLTVTNPNMTRFVMTLDDSVDLILKALNNCCKSGETLIPKIPSMKIGDLAEIFSQKYNKPIKYIGLRPGEKLHEDLINESESSRTIDIDTHYIIGPAYKPGKGNVFSYTSADNVMSKQQLHDHLSKLGILDLQLDKFLGQNIEEIMTNRKS